MVLILVYAPGVRKTACSSPRLTLKTEFLCKEAASYLGLNYNVNSSGSVNGPKGWVQNGFDVYFNFNEDDPHPGVSPICLGKQVLLQTDICSLLYCNCIL